MKRPFRQQSGRHQHPILIQLASTGINNPELEVVNRRLPPTSRPLMSATRINWISYSLFRITFCGKCRIDEFRHQPTVWIQQPWLTIIAAGVCGERSGLCFRQLLGFDSLQYLLSYQPGTPAVERVLKSTSISITNSPGNEDITQLVKAQGG